VSEKRPVTKRSDRVTIHLLIPRDARQILDQVVGPKGRTHGQFVARLLYEYRAREEGRLEARTKAARALAAGKP
jgi:hypothetical protein